MGGGDYVVAVVLHARTRTTIHARTQFSAMADYSCRLCRAAILAKNVAAIFSPTAAKQRVSTRIQDLLGVEVTENDGLPQHICHKCKRRLETLERATEDLKKFRSIASTSYEIFVALKRGPLKRTKETSAYSGVSPDTEKSRPPPKRQLSRRQLNFEEGKNILYITHS